MSKPEPIKPELLPVDLGGGDIQFVKRADYAKRTAENFALKHKAEVKKDHVTQCLDFLDTGGRELEGENPEELTKLFDVVKEDYLDAVKKIEDDKAKAEEEKAAQEKAAKEKAEKEEALFVEVKNEKADFATLAKTFDTGNMDRFIPRGKVSDQQLLAALNTGLGMSEFTNWMIGDLVVELEKRGQENVVARLAESRGVAYSKLYNDAKTAKAIPPDDRKSGVSFTVYREVANAKIPNEKLEDKKKLLAEVGEGKHTTQTVREAVRKLQGKEDPVDLLPEENPKKDFLIIDLNIEITKAVQMTTGFPKELFDEGAIIVDPKTMKKFAKNGFSKKPENRWEDLEEYTKPKPPKEEPPKDDPRPAAKGKGKGKK